MSHKTNPIANRLPLTKLWRSRWFSHRHLIAFNVIEDARIRALIRTVYGKEGSIERVEIERNPQEIKITINTARPGVVIGRGGEGITKLRNLLERKIRSFRDLNTRVYIRSKTDLTKLLPQKLKLEIVEVRAPELYAHLVAESIAYQIEKRIPYRRVVKQAIEKTMQKGAKGIKISVAGRLGGTDIARREKFAAGTVPLATLRNDIDYDHVDAKTASYGTIGVKVWIYRGDKLAEALKPQLRRPSM